MFLAGKFKAILVMWDANVIRWESAVDKRTFRNLLLLRTTFGSKLTPALILD